VFAVWPLFQNCSGKKINVYVNSLHRIGFMVEANNYLKQQQTSFGHFATEI
jgi:hypothetical protein